MKDMKRQTLLELVDYVNTPAGQKIFTESVMSDLMAMVSANVCRALPPATDDFDPEEDEPVLEPAWPHLQVVSFPVPSPHFFITLNSILFPCFRPTNSFFASL